MNKTLLLTDLHLTDKAPGYLDSQIDCIEDIVRKENPDDIIIMGDVFMHRRPSPKVLLATKSLLEWMIAYLPCLYPFGRIHILRGNHDSETKADDGLTALSLFEDKGLINGIQVYTQTAGITKRIKVSGLKDTCVFIPHYEDQNIIKSDLRRIKNGSVLFGHFGYSGCLNSLGNTDFDIKLSEFPCPTFLGHIHRYSASEKHEVVLLGTHYTTNFGEAGKDNYYGVFEDNEFKLRISKGGPKHIVAYYNDEYFLETLDIPEENFVLLRIYIDPIKTKVNCFELKEAILDRWDNVKSVDFTYKSSFDKLDDLSSHKESNKIFTIDEKLIKDYVKDNNAGIPFDDLMSGFYTLSEALNDNK